VSAQTTLQIVETKTNIPDKNILPKPRLRTRLGLALIVVSVPLTLAWVALLGWTSIHLGWLSIQLVRSLL
jgi:hypothetical protein